VAAEMKKSLETTDPHPGGQIEHRIIYADGEIGYISMRYFTVKDNQGRPVKTYGVMQDITERKRMEEALRQSEQRKTTLNQIATIFLTIPDAEMYGEVLAVVLQAMRSKFGTFGYIGGNGDLIIPSLTRGISGECQVPGKSIVFPPDTWGESLWSRAIREKKAFYSDGPFRTPEGHVHIDNFLTVPIVFGKETIGLLSVANKDGGYTEEDRELQESIANFISPILNARLQRDRQERERKRAEKVVLESEEKFRMVSDFTYDWEYWLKPDGNFVYISPSCERITGYRVDEFFDNPKLLTSIVHPDDYGRVSQYISEVLKPDCEICSYDFRIITRGGEERWISHHCQPVYSQDGIWLGRRGSSRDITERKRAE
ncbi:MAG: PAS domain S-box protein, partial [Alphaproteobacteria bacterium]